VFLLVAIGIGIVVYVSGRAAPPLRGWLTDLDEALKLAQQEDRKVVVLFADHPASETGKTLIKGPLNKPDNRNALKEGNFVAVQVRLTGSIRKKMIDTYDLGRRPVLLLLDATGKEITRREGQQTINELGFRTSFLKGLPPN
jgi:hypothetical protein